MENKNIYQSIRTNIDKYDYKNALIDINKYLEDKENGIFDSFLLNYILCLIKLGYFNEAKKQIETANHLFPYLKQTSQMVQFHILCNELDKANEILKENNYHAIDYYHIAKSFYNIGDYKEAQTYFSKAKEMGLDAFYEEKCMKYGKMIQNFLNDNKFIKIDYKYFKKNNHALEPGYIIRGFVEEEKYRKIDPKYDKRTYLIYKIEGEKIYVFPVTDKTKTNNGYKIGYVLYEQDYQNFDGDRTVKNRVVTIKENKVESVVERITPEDLALTIKSVYRGTLIHETNQIQKENKKFINEMKESFEIEKNDILAVFNKEDRKLHFYYITSIDKKNKSFYTVELKKQYIDGTNDPYEYVIKDMTPIKIKYKSNIISCKKAYENKKIEFNKQLLEKEPKAEINAFKEYNIENIKNKQKLKCRY